MSGTEEKLLIWPKLLTECTGVLSITCTELDEEEAKLGLWYT
jgi:hypothetical protein